MQVIGVGGGSGTGKTTVSDMLVHDHPDRFAVLHLDDYQLAITDPYIPRHQGMINWDHPDVVNWADLRRDIAAFSRGEQVEVQTWIGRSIAGIRGSRLLLPAEDLIVEGHLALQPTIADEYDKRFFFQLNEQARQAQRRAARGGPDIESVGDRYRVEVLEPMYQLYIEPTKATADVVIDVTGKTVADIAAVVLRNL